MRPPPLCRITNRPCGGIHEDGRVHGPGSLRVRPPRHGGATVKSRLVRVSGQVLGKGGCEEQGHGLGNTMVRGMRVSVRGGNTCVVIDVGSDDPDSPTHTLKPGSRRGPATSGICCESGAQFGEPALRSKSSVRPSEASRGGGGEGTVQSQKSPLHQDHTDPPLVLQPILNPVRTSPSLLKSCTLARLVHAPTDNCVGPALPCKPRPS